MRVNDCQFLRADGQFENGSQKIGQHVKMSAEETFENMVIYRGEQGLFHALIITIAKADDKHVIRNTWKKILFPYRYRLMHDGCLIVATIPSPHHKHNAYTSQPQMKRIQKLLQCQNFSNIAMEADGYCCKERCFLQFDR